MELRNAVSKETLRKYLLTSSAEAIPQARPSLLSCFTNAENPKSQLQDRLSAAGEALESCSETALQSWFDPLEILLDQEAGTLAVRFPHAFFGIRFSSLFQKLFEKKARELWGKGLSITYGAGKFTPSPPVPFVQPAPESRQDALHPAVANPMPLGEEWTFDTFIGNGKHKWALSLARDITRRAVYRATHGRAPSLDDIGEAPGLLVLCGPHGTGKTHLLRAIGNELFRTLGSDLYYASLSDLELLFAGRSVLAARQELLSKEAVLIDDFQHLSRIPDKTPTTTSRFRNHLFSAARIARQRKAGKRRIGRNYFIFCKRRDKRNKAACVAAGIRNSFGSGDSLPVIGNFGKTVYKILIGAVGGRGVDYYRVGILGKRRRLARRVIGQAQNGDIRRIQSVPS